MLDNLRSITLPNGSVLELQMSEKFLAKVRKQFNIPDDQEITDEHLTMVVYGSVKNAVDKVDESER